MLNWAAAWQYGWMHWGEMVDSNSFLTNQAGYTTIKKIVPLSVNHNINCLCWQTNICQQAMVKLIQPIKPFNQQQRVDSGLGEIWWDSFLSFHQIQFIYSSIFRVGLLLSCSTLTHLLTFIPGTAKGLDTWSPWATQFSTVNISSSYFSHLLVRVLAPRISI